MNNSNFASTSFPVALFFRGRNTAGIMEDAKACGVLRGDMEVLVVCRDGDNLKEGGDLTVMEAIDAIADENPRKYTIVANGGTTSQAVRLCSWMAHYIPHESLCILDMQRDSCTVLWGGLKPYG